jgi:hypothetical protein
VRPLLVGEAPSRTGDRFHRFPLSGAPARVLCLCAGWEPDGPASDLGSWTWALYSRFETANVFPRSAQSRPWDRDRARASAAILSAGGHSHLVLLGRKVADAFGVGKLAYFEPWQLVAGQRLVVIPHPSGRNLLMNDDVVREQTGIALRNAVRDSEIAHRSRRTLR